MSDKPRTKATKVTVDWDSVEIAYYRGSTHASLCEQFGCTPTALAKQILRKGWAQKRQVANRPAPVSPAAPAENIESLAEISRRTRVSTARELAKILDALEALPNNPNLSKLKLRSEILRVCAGVGEVACDWRTSPGREIINLDQLRSARLPEPRAIDVAPQSQLPAGENPPSGTPNEPVAP